MDITLEKTAPNYGFIKVKVEPADYQPKVEKKLKQYRREADLKGFRPGKAPLGLIKKMYGRQTKVSEILDLAHESLNKYLKDNSELRIVGEVMPVTEGLDGFNWKKDTDYEFRYEVGLAPDFTYAPEQFKMTEHIIQVKDEEVESRIKDLQMRVGENEQPETVEEEGHEHCVVMGKFSLDKSEGDTIDQEDDEHFELKLPLNRMEDDVAALFVGKSLGDSMEIDLKEAFPDEKDREELLNIDEVILEENSKGLLVIDAINKTIPATLDQDFIDKVLQQGEHDPAKMQELYKEEEEEEAETDQIEEAEVIDEDQAEEPAEVAEDNSEDQEEEPIEVAGDSETEAEDTAEDEEEEAEKEYIEGEAAFREKLREQMSEMYQSEVRKIMAQRIQDEFTQQTEINLPDEFLKRWLIESSNKDESSNEKLTAEDIKEEYPYFREQLKWSLISNQIAKDQGFQVDYVDMLQAAKGIVGKQFKEMGMDMNQFGDQFADQFANDYLTRDEGKNVSEVMSAAIQQQVTDWLLDQIQIEQEEVTIEAFREFIEAKSKETEERAKAETHEDEETADNEPTEAAD